MNIDLIIAFFAGAIVMAFGIKLGRGEKIVKAKPKFEPQDDRKEFIEELKTASKKVILTKQEKQSLQTYFQDDAEEAKAEELEKL